MYSRYLLSPILAIAVAGAAHAGTTESTTTTITQAPSESLISGTIVFDANSHFISYGSDVWGDGDSFSEPAFNPLVEFALELPAGFTATIGTWWDVNSKTGSGQSPIGGRIQEIDVWAGLAYTIGDFTVKGTYQAWMYGSDTEEIIDLAFSYDTFLSPSITIHHRLDQGAAYGDEGTVIVGALSYSIDAGPVTFSFPFNVAYFVDDDFHNPYFNGGADNGFGYGSISANASVPLSFIPEAYGDWSVHAGVSYYVTDQDVIPNNVEGDFFTANVGVTIAF